GPASSSRNGSTNGPSPVTSTTPICPTSTCSSGPRGSSGPATSCSGSPRTPNWRSSTRSGPTSTAAICGPQWRDSPPATVVSVEQSRIPPELHPAGPVTSRTMTSARPTAKQVPYERTHHGDTVIDPYAWMADKDNHETIAYLEAENAYTEASTAHLTRLREQIFTEIKERTQETDLSVPVLHKGWWHYSRTVEGQQYAIHCRSKAI